MGWFNGGIVYSTERKEWKTSQKQWSSEWTRKDIGKALADGTTETINRLEKTIIYGIGYPQWMGLWEELRQIDPALSVKKYPQQIKKINGNIIAEYLRAVQESPRIIQNDPQTLLDVMHYANESYTQHTLDIVTCRKIRIFITKSYKHLLEDKGADNKKMIKNYENILEKTKHITVD